MKAVCVLEAILRKKDDDHFSPVESYFTENKDVVLRCSESPQASLRERAMKVPSLSIQMNSYYVKIPSSQSFLHFSRIPIHFLCVNMLPQVAVMKKLGNQEEEKLVI